MSYRKIAFDGIRKQIKLWTWADNGDRILKYIPFKPYLFVECQDHQKDALSIFGTPLKKLEFETSWERRQWVENTSNRRIFYNLSPEQQFLIDYYHKQSDDVNFSQFPLKVGILDIEVYCKVGFPHAEEANHIINAITIYDSIAKKFNVFGLKNDFDSSKFPDVIYHRYEKETLLLKGFIEHLEANDYDLITGWNSSNFDIPYIHNRVLSLLGQDWVSRISPTGRCYSVQKKDKFGKHKTVYEFKPLVHLDYIELYRYFKMGEKESYSLEFIAQEELGRGKIKYDGNLADLADLDWQKFIEYNIEDVRLHVDIDAKNKLIELARLICYKGLCDFSNALGKVIVTTGCVAIQAKRDGLIIPTFKNNGGKEDYVGGAVFEPRSGRMSDIVSFDANSLYPSVMMSLNISPESKVGKIISDDGTNVTLIMQSGTEKTLTREKLELFCGTNKIAISSYGVLYSQKKDSVVKRFLDNTYNQRKSSKDRMNKLNNMVDTIIDPIEKEKVEIEIERLDLIQNNLKCVLNSFYGGCGNESHPFYDIDNAASTTLTGQHAIKQASEIVKNYINKKYNIDDVSDVIIYGDTDSLYITLNKVFQKLNIKISDNNNKITDDANKVIFELQDNLNKGINLWSKNTLKSIDSRFVFKRESICDAGIFVGKKNYALHILDNEGKWINKFKYKGVAIAKASTSKEIKNLIKSVIENLILSGDRKLADQNLKDAYEKFLTLSIDDICIRINVKDLRKYESQADGFDTVNRTPYHVKAAIKGNELFKHLGLNKKFSLTSAYSRVKLFYCIRNKYQIEALCYETKFPQELLHELGPDYGKMFKKTVTKLVEDIYEELGYSMPDVVNPMSISIDEIS